MKTYITILSFLFCLGVTAQTTSIPDPVFEQHLIDEGIDSDGVINGQVLTSDIDTVTVLTLSNVEDLTGLEDFAALKEITLRYGGQPNTNLNVDLTNNNDLEKIRIREFAGLHSLNVTGLINLEELFVSDVSDAPTVMMIDEINLGTNINIQKLYLVNCYINRINLKNGNNHNMINFDLTAFTAGPEPQDDYPDMFCAEVDDASAATANMPPYNSWSVYGTPTYYDQGECVLKVHEVNKIELALYPNPVQNSFQIQTSVEIQSVQIFSITGKAIASFGAQQNYDIAGLSAGVYFVKVQSENGERIQRIIKQ